MQARENRENHQVDMVATEQTSQEISILKKRRAAKKVKQAAKIGAILTAIEHQVHFGPSQ